MVPYNGCLYVFGGEISFSNASETPLWIYNIQVGRRNKIFHKVPLATSII